VENVEVGEKWKWNAELDAHVKLLGIGVYRYTSQEHLNILNIFSV